MRQFWLGCILLSTAVSSSAVTLGRYSGAAVIGRPLDIRAQVLLSPGEDASSLCLSAEVFYGDTRVGGVQTQIQQTAPDAGASLRIQTTQAINEPIVTVFVRAGCEAPFSRRYVLLADPISEPLAQQAPPAQALPSVAPGQALASDSAPAQGGATAAPVPSEQRSGGPSDQEPGTLAAAPVARPAARTAPPRPPRPASVVRRPAPPAPPGPRLQLDPVDINLGIERDPVLRLSLSLLSEPASSEDVRQAAGLLWKALNASPEDVMRDAQKLAVLEAEAQGLRDEEAKNRAQIADLQAQLENAGQRNWWLYGMALLLLLSLLALAVLMRRRRTESREVARAKAWWNEEVAQRPLGDELENAGSRGDRSTSLDIDLAAESDFQRSASSLAPLSQSEALDSEPGSSRRGSDHREFAPSAMGVSRSVATEELFDVQQQADFFISLGEDEQAIQVLKNHLAESQEPSPLAYLDLLNLYHRLDRRSEYDTLRDRFNEVFNAGAPRFEQFSDRGDGLERYETAMGRIQALWPQPRVLDVIEQSIFRDPSDKDGEVFDLEAYRELLLLHALAKEIIRTDQGMEASGEAPPPKFGHTKIQPLKAAAASAAGTPTQPHDIIPPASPNLGLDVDLDELAELSAFEASLPEVDVKVEPTARSSGVAGDKEPGVASNLIDFEVLDFLHSAKDSAPLDEGKPPRKPGKGGKEKADE